MHSLSYIGQWLPSSWKDYVKSLRFFRNPDVDMYTWLFFSVFLHYKLVVFLSHSSVLTQVFNFYILKYKQFLKKKSTFSNERGSCYFLNADIIESVSAGEHEVQWWWWCGSIGQHMQHEWPVNTKQSVLEHTKTSEQMILIICVLSYTIHSIKPQTKDHVT